MYNTKKDKKVISELQNTCEKSFDDNRLMKRKTGLIMLFLLKINFLFLLYLEIHVKPGFDPYVICIDWYFVKIYLLNSNFWKTVNVPN